MTVDEYTEAELQRLLAERPETAELGIRVMRRDHSLVLCGEVESPKRRDQILRLAQEHFPDIDIRSDIGVTRAGPPSEVEEL